MVTNGWWTGVSGSGDYTPHTHTHCANLSRIGHPLSVTARQTQQALTTLLPSLHQLSWSPKESEEGANNLTSKNITFKEPCYQHTRHLTDHSGQSSQEGDSQNTTHITVHSYECMNVSSDVQHSRIVQHFDHRGLCRVQRTQKSETVFCTQ